VRGDVAVIGVSTALPSPAPLADGWVGGKQLAAIEEALRRNAGRFRVLALHHPPLKNRLAAFRSLRDRGRLQDVLRRVGAELVVHGHEHRDLRASLPGPNGDIPVIGVASGAYLDPRVDKVRARARYNLYQVDDGRLVSIESRVHDPASGRFVSERAHA
jgi:3',5'-cyclic AMP phosphodiesterase CpdA